MTFSNAIETRRSCYNLSGKIPISDEQVQQIIEHSIQYAPSAYNAGTSRVVLLKGGEHKALWGITMEILRGIVPADKFARTESKIDAFAAAHGTILFFEDQDAIVSLQEKFPLYADKFPLWSDQHDGILQFVIWTALAEVGIGASLQHYNPLIDNRVRERWHLPKNWQLVAQMPFGSVAVPPDEKKLSSTEERLKIFGV